MLLALRWRVHHKLLGIHLAPVHLCVGEGPTGTLNTGGVLDNFNPRARIHQPPHQAEVAPKHGLLRPQPNYEALHGTFGRLVELDQLLQLVAKGHRMFGLSILRPEHFFRRAPLFGLVVCDGIRHTTGRIGERSWRAPDSGK